MFVLYWPCAKSNCCCLCVSLRHFPIFFAKFTIFYSIFLYFLPNIHRFTSNFRILFIAFSYIFYYYYCYSLYLFLFHMFSIYLYMLHPLLFLLFARPYSLLFCAQRCLKSLLIHLYRVSYFRPKENVIFLCFRAIK